MSPTAIVGCACPMPVSVVVFVFAAVDMICRLLLLDFVDLISGPRLAFYLDARCVVVFAAVFDVDDRRLLVIGITDEFPVELFCAETDADFFVCREVGFLDFSVNGLVEKQNRQTNESTPATVENARLLPQSAHVIHVSSLSVVVSVALLSVFCLVVAS